MNKRDIMLVGAGLVVGYLLSVYYLKNKEQAKSVTDAKNLESKKAELAKIEACNKEVADFMKTARFSAGVMEQKKKEMFDACMAKNA